MQNLTEPFIKITLEPENGTVAYNIDNRGPVDTTGEISSSSNPAYIPRASTGDDGQDLRNDGKNVNADLHNEHSIQSLLQVKPNSVLHLQLYV